MTEVALALLAGFLVAALGTPVGVSGAVFLLPLQAGVLGVSGPAVSATNLVFNAVSTPLALLRAPRPAGRRGELLVVAGACVPAAVAGAYGRVTLFADPARFRLLVIAVLAPLGVQLLVRAVRGARLRDRDAPPVAAFRLALLALVTGMVGGTIGIGGGSMLAPVLVALAGQSVARAAPLALTSTLATSLSGLVAYTMFDALHIGTPPAAPVWHVGIATGLGGVAGALAGAAVARRIGERVLTLLLGTTATVTAAAHVVQLAQ
ncbi:sulfite exporter TauE/SafE family protein [Herbidospora daliensis]|uniref:sulfite exporter TauE/SafE family protein n=1 Tax=Herbidospora daliensis TaxID=295585 RepID=UPI0007867C15|nr:sulfite exporter TauE/SafE family protein [Herbidospora daliensis]